MSSTGREHEPSVTNDAVPNPTTSTGQGHWFAHKDVDVMFFRINRRSETLFQPPPDVLEHIERVLSTPRTVETGRRYKRIWHAGNKHFDHQAGILTGMIGWARSAEALSSTWDERTQSWIDVIVPEDVSAVAPFAFTADSRFLGVLKHSTFTERNIVQVFADLLNGGERDLPFPTTEWDVEPVGDVREFYEWVASTDRVLSVEFVFKRPNPDAEDAFRDLFDRLDELEAKQIRELITARDPDRGLSKQALRTEPTSRGFIAAAMAAFGYLVGLGMIGNKKTKWDQRSRAARERLEDVTPTWDGATEEVLSAVRRAVARRRHG